MNVRFTRENQPVTGVPVYLVAHYKTVEERFPENNGTVQTNVNGEATIENLQHPGPEGHLLISMSINYKLFQLW